MKLNGITAWTLFHSLAITRSSSAFTTANAARAFSTTTATKNTKRTTTTSISMTATSEQRAPYGAWESAITSKAITSGSVSLGGLRVCDSHLYWLEGRPQEGGRNVLCRLSIDNDTAASVAASKEEVTPKTTNVRTRVHEYGGAAVTYGSDANHIYVSEFATQQLCHLVVDGDDDNKAAEALTPDDNRFRFADGSMQRGNNGVMYCVREDHAKPEPINVVNEVVAVDLASNKDKVKDAKMTVLATGNDFYAAPRISPDGTQVAYITWDHPNMPWDATELRVTTIANKDDAKTSSSQTKDHKLVAGTDGDTSILQPIWHPTSGDLYYLSDESGYYNLYRAGTKESILPMKFDFGGSAPGWSLGQQGFGFLEDGRLVATYTKEGKSVLLVATVSGDGAATDVQEYSGEKDGLPMQFGGVISGGVCGKDGDLFFLGGSPSTPNSIFQWNLMDRTPAKSLVCSSTLSFDDGIISVPEQVEFPTTNGRTAFGYYYPPKNSQYKAPSSDEAPPLLVKAHGGPTACTGTSFNAGIQFWTSRGFAVLDVDYGGSTGYGRDYRRRLRKSWGIVDIDDVCAGAEYLVTKGKADGKRLCIDGGSAGGYTTLGALAFRDVFHAGCSLYGIGDLTALAGDTHKFESRYLDGLVGKYPEDKAIYLERSPIESVDTLSCPILILQGEEDKVVPPNQARMMHEALLKKGLPACLKIYEGEQHGFRKAENIQDALDSELAFYGKVFGIDVVDAIPTSTNQL